MRERQRDRDARVLCNRWNRVHSGLPSEVAVGKGSHCPHNRARSRYSHFSCQRFIQIMLLIWSATSSLFWSISSPSCHLYTANNIKLLLDNNYQKYKLASLSFLQSSNGTFLPKNSYNILATLLVHDTDLQTQPTTAPFQLFSTIPINE